jgi:hypothetical protein
MCDGWLVGVKGSLERVGPGSMDIEITSFFLEWRGGKLMS